MHGTVDQERPVDGEVPDLGALVEIVAGIAAGGDAEGPVEGGEVGGVVVCGDDGDEAGAVNEGC